MSFTRLPSNQDVSWFIDLHASGRLDLEPPYQRKSVWSAKDRKFFLDTIFRGYPSPAIYLHKKVDELGRTTYEVIDGKQRLETVIKFFENKIPLGKDFGDIRLDGLRWKNVFKDPEMRSRFVNYVFSVDFISVDNDWASLNEVFDRLNRNSRKLNEQELRHAKHDGWFINFIETEIAKSYWVDWGISTAGKTKRMKDAQFVSELLMVVIDGEPHGFSQELINSYYADYDYPEEDEELDFDIEDCEQKFNDTVSFLKIVDEQIRIKDYASDLKEFYTLWVYVCKHEHEADAATFAEHYKTFMDEVYAVQEIRKGNRENEEDEYCEEVKKYVNNLSGASTEEPQRIARFEALESYIERVTAE